MYHLSEEEESELANSAPSRRSRPQGDPNAPKQNKHKKPRAQEDDEIQRPIDGIYSFHPEDDIIMKVRAHQPPLPLRITFFFAVCAPHIDVSFCFSVTPTCTRDAGKRRVWT